MRYIKQIFKDTENELEYWQELLGGSIVGNSLYIPEGIIKAYDFGKYRMIAMKLCITEEIITKRIVSKPMSLYPIIFSYNLTFEPDLEGITNVVPSKSLSTSIYFSDKETLFHYNPNTDFNMILFRVPYQVFEQLLSDGHPFLKYLTSGESYHFYESLSVEMKIRMQQIFHVGYPELLEEEFVKVRSWELFLLFVEKFFYQRKNHYQRIPPEVQLKLHLVKEFMLSDLSSPKGIEELVEYSGMSATRLRSAFKEVYGMSIYTFFQEHRMEKACELLQTGEKSVSEVAYELGYTHLGHFTEMFKKKYHCLPKNFK